MATDNAYFFEHTNIWNRDGDYLYADRGSYVSRYALHRDAQRLYPDRSRRSGATASTITGRRITSSCAATCNWTTPSTRRSGSGLRRVLEGAGKCVPHAPARGGELRPFAGRLAFHAGRLDVSLHDQLRGGTAGCRRARRDSLAAGGEAVREPEAGAKDPLVPEDSLAGERRVRLDSLGRPLPTAPGVDPGSVGLRDSLGRPEVPDSLGATLPADSLATPVDPLDTLVGDARKAYLKEQARKAKAAEKAAKAGSQEGVARQNRRQTAGEGYGETAGPEGA